MITIKTEEKYIIANSEVGNYFKDLEHKDCFSIKITKSEKQAKIYNHFGDAMREVVKLQSFGIFGFRVYILYI